MLHIGFYQLGEVSLNDAILMLIKKTHEVDKKVLVYCPNPAAAEIDDALWSHDPVSWLPHGLDSDNGKDLSSVWISSDMKSNPIKASFLMLLHGAEPESWLGFERAFVLFDGKSEAQLDQARAQWKNWKDLSDTTLTYFVQASGGKWKKKV